jgi:chemotaxis protein methyltransferase CheR
MFKSSNFDIQSQIEELFLHNLGWKISLDNKYSDKKIENICKKMGFEEISELILSFQDNRYSEKLIQTLAHEFSIGESYFFRDKKFFNILENKIIPQLLKEKNINIWSVGCSSGEEAYSVAMMLDKNIPNISEWNIFILGTDINIDFLSKAKRGVYTNHSLHNMPQYYKEKYFKKLDNKYEISPLIKKKCSL